MTKEVVLLTGFAGFIGSQILRDLLAKGYKVIGVDNMSEGSSIHNFEEVKNHGDFHPIFMDMGSKDLEEKLGHIDYVVNCGAQSHVDRSFDQYEKFISSNILGPLNLARIALKMGVKKFVQVSTDEVFSEAEQPFHEGSELTPQNAYASSKASAEMFLMNFQRAFGLPLVITNGANTYGHRQFEEKIIPLTIKKLVKGETVPLYKTPAQRMWLHVESHASGIIAAMEKGVIGQRYCLAPSEEDELYTHELVKKICALLGKDFDECVKCVPDRPNYDLRYYMLNVKAKMVLGWEPTKHIADEIEGVVKYYQNKFSKE